MLFRLTAPALCAALAAATVAPSLQHPFAAEYVKPVLSCHPGHPDNDGFFAAPKLENKTIYQYLSDTPEYSRIFKFVNFTETITNLLNDSSSKVTFFAPSNHALTPPKHRRRRHAHGSGEDFTIEDHLRALLDDSDIEKQLRSLMDIPQSQVNRERETLAAIEGLMEYSADDDEHKKEILKKIVTALLSYHIIPSVLPFSELGTNNTWGTQLSLKDGSLDGEAYRLRIAPSPNKVLPLTLSVNLFSTIIKADTGTLNGIIHKIDRPVFPPPSTFQTLFLLPKIFSTLTSAVQRTGLTDDVDWHFVRGKGDEKGTIEGSPVVTFFAPIDKAWDALPQRLRLFLFSPFGERALKKLLSLHVVPEYILLSDWTHNATDEASGRRSVTIREVDDDELSNSGESSLYEYADSLQLHISRSRCSARAQNPTVFRSSEEGLCHPHSAPLPNFCNHNSLSVIQQLGGATPYHQSGLIIDTEQLRGRPVHAPDAHPKPVKEDIVFSREVNVSSLLPKHSLHVHVIQHVHSLPLPGHPFKKYNTDVFVNGQQVLVADLPTRNGALHVLSKLIHPFKHQDHHSHSEEMDNGASANAEVDDWEDWEDWLPQWAEED